MSGSNLQIGKNGPKIKISSGVVEFRNAADNAYAVARGGNPIDDDDAAPKAWAFANIGDSGIPFSVIEKSDTTGTDTYTLPTAVAGDTITVSKHSSHQMTNLLRIAPASGDKIAIYGHVVENPGYIEVYNPATVFKFCSMNADIWALVSHYSQTEVGELIGQNNFALVGRDTWVSKATPLTTRSYPSGTNLNGYGYSTCGYSGATVPQTTHERYDDVANSWTTMAVNPTARYYTVGNAVEGFVYVTCGSIAGNVASAVHTQYNDGANTWATKTANPTARRLGMGFSLNGFAYMVDGQVGGGGTAVANNDQYSGTTNAWVAKTADPFARKNGTSWTLNSYGYTVSGDITATPEVRVHQYSDIANAWIVKAPIPSGSANIGGFVNNGYGYTAMDSTANLTQQYNDALNSWTIKTSNPNSGAGRGFAFNGYGYTIGNGLLEQYN